MIWDDMILIYWYQDKKKNVKVGEDTAITHIPGHQHANVVVIKISWRNGDCRSGIPGLAEQVQLGYS